MRIEPPPSAAIATGPIPAATAAPDPALEPPEVSSGVPRVADGLGHRAVAGAAVAELGHGGLAEHDRAGGAQALDDHVVLVGDVVAVCRRAAGHRHAGDGDEVLDADRHAAQGAAVGARGERALERPGRVERVLVGPVAEGVQARLEAVHPAMDRLDDVDRRELAAADRRREVDRRERAGIRGHSAPTGSGTAATRARLCAATASIARYATAPVTSPTTASDHCGAWVVHEPRERGADRPRGERGRTDRADDPRVGGAAEHDLVGDEHRADRRDEHAEDHEPAQEVAPHAGERDPDTGDAEQERQHAHATADDVAPAHGPVVQAMRAHRAEVDEHEDDRERAQQRAARRRRSAAGSCRRRSPARRSRRRRRRRRR